MATIEPLHPAFGAELSGVDLTAPLDAATFEGIKGALDRYSLLVFRAQPVDDVAQIAFAAQFGRLEKTRLGAVGEGGDLVVLTNLDADGAVVSPSSKKLFDARANQLWHSDASFRPVPAYASVLSGRRVATRGGQTQFASTRVAYATLDEATRAQILNLKAIHHFAYSRSLIEAGRLARAESEHLPPVRHPIVRTHSATGEPALFIGSHMREIEGLAPEQSRKLIDGLLAHTTRAASVHTHRWQPFDVIVWDNSAVVHRGKPWDESEPRHLVRATVADDGFTAGELAAA